METAHGKEVDQVGWAARKTDADGLDTALYGRTYHERPIDEEAQHILKEERKHNEHREWTSMLGTHAAEAGTLP